MPRGGARSGAGRPRKPRTPDELQEFEDKLAADRATPDLPTGIEQRYETAVEFAMAIINDDSKPLSERRRLAIAVMPYQSPKVAADLGGKKGARQAAAKTAGEGSDWGGDLTYEPPATVN